MKVLALVLGLLFILCAVPGVNAQAEDTIIMDPAGIFRIFLVMDFLARTFMDVLMMRAVDFFIVTILLSPLLPLWQRCGSFLTDLFIGTILDCGSVCLYNYGLWMVISSFIPVLNSCCLPICAVLCIPFSAIIGSLGSFTGIFDTLRDLCWRVVQNSYQSTG